MKIVSKGLVIMDVPTRWNSTYLMLQSALKFHAAFDRLKDDDSGYESYFISDKMIGHQMMRIGKMKICLLIS